jgi:hypothetical protein
VLISKNKLGRYPLWVGFNAGQITKKEEKTFVLLQKSHDFTQNRPKTSSLLLKISIPKIQIHRLTVYVLNVSVVDGVVLFQVDQPNSLLLRTCVEAE